MRQRGKQSHTVGVQGVGPLPGYGVPRGSRLQKIGRQSQASKQQWAPGLGCLLARAWSPQSSWCLCPKNRNKAGALMSTVTKCGDRKEQRPCTALARPRGGCQWHTGPFSRREGRRCPGLGGQLLGYPGAPEPRRSRARSQRGQGSLRACSLTSHTEVSAAVLGTRVSPCRVQWVTILAGQQNH